jgi:hypothetical protein
MYRLASGEAHVELETHAEVDAEQTVAQGDPFDRQDSGNTVARSPHNSRRSIHASSHSLAVPGSPVSRLSYHSEGDFHAVRHCVTSRKPSTVLILRCSGMSQYSSGALST